MLDAKMIDVRMTGVHMENAIGPHGQMVPTHRIQRSIHDGGNFGNVN